MPVGKRVVLYFVATFKMHKQTLVPCSTYTQFLSLTPPLLPRPNRTYTTQ